MVILIRCAAHHAPTVGTRQTTISRFAESSRYAHFSITIPYQKPREKGYYQNPFGGGAWPQKNAGGFFVLGGEAGSHSGCSKIPPRVFHRNKKKEWKTFGGLLHFTWFSDIITVPHKFYNQSSHQRMCFYFGKNAGSLFVCLLHGNEFVSQQWSYCVFRA